MMPEDPFATLFEPQQPSEPPQEPTAKRPSATKLRKGTFVYDFETVPDESRFPRPVPSAAEEKELDIGKTLGGTIAAITEVIESGLSPEQGGGGGDAEKATAKPRKGVIDTITRALKAEADAFEMWKKQGSVNPFRAKIVAMGWVDSSPQGVKPKSMTARTEDEERAILQTFWKLVDTKTRRSGFNILGFDDLLAIVRSLILNVPPSRPLDRRKYGNREAIDMMVHLFPSGGSQPCKDVCGAMGIVPPAGEDMDGSKVFDLYEAGDMEAIATYVESDVVIELELLNLFSDYLVM
jgi:hypothetical protein